MCLTIIHAAKRVPPKTNLSETIQIIFNRTRKNQLSIIFVYWVHAYSLKETKVTSWESKELLVYQQHVSYT